jgi:hypothetical protein
MDSNPVLAVPLAPEVHGTVHTCIPWRAQAQSGRPWASERLPLPCRLRCALLVLAQLDTFWVIWLATVVSVASPCAGPICTVATLDHHAAALLACGAFCIALYRRTCHTDVATRGFSKCNGALIVAAAAGGLSQLGLAAITIGALIALIVLATFVLATPRHLEGRSIMRGLELFSPSQQPEVLGPPGLTGLSAQIKQRWPSAPPPILEWTETLQVAKATLDLELPLTHPFKVIGLEASGYGAHGVQA